MVGVESNVGKDIGTNEHGMLGAVRQYCVCDWSLGCEKCLKHN